MYVDFMAESEDGLLPELPAPISEASLADEAARFSWEATEPLTELDGDGSLALHYVAIALDDREQYDALEAAEVHWSPIPMFEADRQGWDEPGVLMPGNEMRGTFVYALLPGATYNLLRSLALDGEVLFRAVMLREVPEGAVGRGSGGWVSLAALHASGTCFRPFCALRAEGDGEVGVAREALVEDLRDGFAMFVDTNREIVLSVPIGIGQLEIFFAGSRLLPIEAFQYFSDPDFGVGVPRQDSRVWGAQRGALLRFAETMLGMRVFLFEVGGAGLWTGVLGPDATTTIPVPPGRRVNLCLETRTPHATVTADVIPAFVCDPTFGSTNAALAVIDMREARINATLYVTEGRLFLNEVMGQFPTRSATVLIGNAANFVALLSGGAFAPGLGGRDPGTRMAIAGLEAAILPVVPIAVAVLPLLAVDLVVPDASLNSRIILAHEYGHIAFYQMLAAASPTPDRYAQHLLTMLSLALLAAATPALDPVIINEAFADWFAVQLSGGANRLRAGAAGIILPPRTYSGNIFNVEIYCDQLGPARPALGCMEFNGTGVPNTDPLNDRVTQYSTLFFDMFDGAPLGPFTLHNGTAWVRETAGACLGRGIVGGVCPSATLTANGGPNAFDEPVLLPPQAMIFWLQTWLFDPFESAIFSTNTLMHAASRAMRTFGVADANICALYGLHNPGGVCPAFWMAP